MNLSDWTFFMDGFEPLPCRAPCTMYSVLLENGKIPDPFYGVNEQTLRHLGERDCAFETEFTVDAGIWRRNTRNWNFPVWIPSAASC